MPAWFGPNSGKQVGDRPSLEWGLTEEASEC